MSSNPFPMAAGYGNFPNGNFIPDLFAKELLTYNQQISIVDNITNNEYEGQISAMGDTIHIRKQPKVTVRSYTRGQDLEFQEADDEETTLVIDQANYFAYKFDDIFLQQKDVNIESALADSAKYELRDQYDRTILTNMAAAVASDNIVGSSVSKKTIGYASGADFTPLNALARMARLLNDAKAPTTGRFAVVGTEFVEALQQETGLLMDANVNGIGSAALDLGLLNRQLHNFTLFMTTNAPTDMILGGTTRAYATANTILKTEVKPMPNTFGYGVAGLHVFGDGVLRPSELALMHIDVTDASLS